MGLRQCNSQLMIVKDLLLLMIVGPEVHMLAVFPGSCKPYMVQPNLAPGLVMLYLAPLVDVQTALSKYQGKHLEEPASAESRVRIRHLLLHSVCGPRGPLDNQQ